MEHLGVHTNSFRSVRAFQIELELALTFCCLYSYRSRLQVLERKLMCLETFNNIYRALDQMRSSSVIPDTETNEEMRQRVTEECKWFV